MGSQIWHETRQFYARSGQVREFAGSVRRDIARWHDSYAWQKLLWIGLGILPHALIGAGLLPGEYVVALLCLVAGGVGLFFWKRTSAVQLPT